MKIILLSGGSGKRLWPLSNDKHPKQLLKLLTDDQGRPMSMLQQVWGRLRRRGLERSAVIATASVQRESIREQLGSDVDLVLEPEKRDTFPAVLLAVAYLNSRRGLLRDEPVLVMPVDGLADDLFYETMLRLPETLERSGANLALLGVKPDRPSEKYGYMIPSTGPDETPLTISHFREKPSRKDASEYIRAGALWNCGVFCFRAGYLLDRLERMGLPETYEELLLSYSRLTAESFDYAVAEKETNLAALVYDGQWKDLGTWCSLTKAMNRSVLGNGVLTDDCQDVHIVNATDTPVIAMGLTDIAIAVGEEGILVTAKSVSSRLKDALRQLEAAEEQARPEGGVWSKTLDNVVFPDGTSVTTRRIHLDQGASMIHAAVEGIGSDVSWTILHGKAMLSLNGARQKLSQGSTVKLQADDEGGLFAEGPLDIIEVSTDHGKAEVETHGDEKNVFRIQPKESTAIHEPFGTGSGVYGASS
ncbi:MAG: mannose-phosphate guanylyltransferase [Paenibacillus sp.]|nr:mannose-phosphate guanylyltransferase [Paenibacillus sp.]